MRGDQQGCATADVPCERWPVFHCERSAVPVPQQMSLEGSGAHDPCEGINKGVPQQTFLVNGGPCSIPSGARYPCHSRCPLRAVTRTIHARGSTRVCHSRR